MKLYSLACYSILFGNLLANFTVSPEGPYQLEVGFGQSDSLELSVTNNAATPSEIDVFFSDGIGSELDDVRVALNEVSSTLLATLPDRYFFSDGINSNNIGDGGGDMYDGGNFLTFGSGFPALDYSDDLVITQANSNVTYFTRKFEGLFVLAADYGNESEFRITGNLGADGSGSVDLREFEPGFGYRAFYKSVHSAGDPSVNHLILVPDSPGLARISPTSTNDDLHTVTGLPAGGRLYHLLFAKQAGARFSDLEVESLAETFLRTVRSGPGWIDYPRDTSVASSATVPFTLQITSEGLAPGSYRTSLALAPADTDPDGIPAGDFHDISLTVAPPEFTLDTNEVTVSAILGAPITPLTITLVPGDPGFTFNDLEIESDSPWLNATRIPGENAIEIAPESVGANSASLRVTAGNTTQVVSLRFLLAPLNIAQLLPDPNRSRLYAINQSGKEQGAVLVIDTLSQSVIKNIAVGAEPTDLALTEDSAELLVMNTSDPSIQRIDLTSLEITATYPLSEFSNRNDDFGGHVVDGPGNIIYYVDEQWGPRLRVFDTSTETVLQTFSAASSDENNTNNDFGYGDIQITPDQSYLYGWRQYGDGAGVGGTNLVRLSIGPDGRLSDLNTGPSRNDANFDRDPYDTPVVISADGSTVIVKDSLIDPSTLLFAGRFPDEIYNITPNAKVVSGAEAIYPINDVDALFDLPSGSRVQAFLPDYSYFVYFHSGELQWVDLVEEIGLEALEISITPAPDSVVAPPSTLEWLPVSGTTEYEVYLGTNFAAVTGASPSSPSFLGHASSASWSLENELAPGIYYWRATPSGISGGEVYQFTVSALGLSRSGIDEATVAGVRQLDGSIGTSSTTPINWEATSDQPWIEILTPTGSSSEPVEYRLSTTNLNAGRYQGTITLTFTGGPLVIPVSLRVESLNFTHLDSDRERARVYLISQPDINGYGPTFLIEADGNTGELLRAVPCGFSVTDLAIHHAENRIYVPNRNSGVLRAFDRDTLEQVQTYQFNPKGDVGSANGDISGVSAGAFGRIVVNEWDQHTTVSLIDTSNGEVLAETGSYSDGRGVHSPDGQIYYHPTIGTSRAALHKYTVSETAFTEVAVFEERRYSDPAVISGDGSRIFWGRDVLNEDMESVLTVDESIVAASFFGDLAFTRTKIYNTRNGEQLANLPVSSSLQTVSHDQQSLLIVESDAITVFDLTSIIDLPSIEILPSIPDGGSVIGTSHDLSWSPVPSAISYEVYLGSNRTEVNAAGPNDPQFIGSVSRNFLPGGIENLSLGETYFWKIVPVGLSGPGTASIWSFDVFPSDITPREIVVTAPDNSPIAPIQLSLTGPNAWTASVTDPFGHWVSLNKESGEPSDQLVVTLDSGSLIAGEDNETFITIESGGSSVNLPIVLDLRPLNYVLAKGDSLSPYLYAISEEDASSETPAFLLKMDTRTEEIVAAVPCGYDVTDFDIHYQENRIYLTNHEAFQVKAFDRDTLAQQQVYSLTPVGTYPRNDPYRVSAGRMGQIMIEGLDQWIDIQLLDTSDGTVLATKGERQGGGVFSTDGQIYYHGDDNSSGAVLSRHDVDDPSLVELGSVRIDTFSYYGSRRVVISGDGSRVFWNGGVFAPDLTVLRTLSPGEVITSSFDGGIAMTNTQVINTTNGSVLADLPNDTTVQALSVDQTKLFLFDGPNFEVVDLSEIADLPRTPLAPAIPDGEIVVGTDHDLSWSFVPSALSYDVYFGSDRDAVNNATPDSEVFLGNTTTPFFEGGVSGLEKGASYYWRVDTRGLGGTQQGETWSFQIAPILVSQQKFSFDIPAGAPLPSQTITIGEAGEDNDWTALATGDDLTIDRATGSSGETLTLTLDSSDLPPGEYEEAIRLTARGQTFELPVSYTIHELNVIKLHSALSPDKVLALSQTTPAGGPSFLLEVAGETGEITRFLEAGLNATDFDLAEDLSRAYLCNNGEAASVVIDLENWVQDGTLALGRSATGISAAPDGTLMVENRGSERRRFLFLPGETTGIQLGFGNNDQFALGALTPDRTFYFTSSSYNNLETHSLEEDTLTRISSEQINTTPPATTIPTLFLSGNGERLFSSHLVFDSERKLTTVLPDVAVATTRSGLVVVTREALYWALSGELVTELSFPSSQAAFTGDDRQLVRYNPETAAFSPLPFAIPTEFPFPQPGQELSQGEIHLSFPPVPGATSYQLLLGTDPDHLSAKATSTESSFALPDEEALFGKIYWRIDATLPDTTNRGPVYSFNLIPNPQPLSTPMDTGLVIAREGSLMASYTSSRDGTLFELPLSDTESTSLTVASTQPPSNDFPFGSNPVFGTHLAKAGDKLFTASNGTLFVVEPRGNNRWQSSREFELASNPARVEDLAGSGDLLFVACNTNNQTDGGRVEVYRTYPGLNLEATILPPETSIASFGSHLATDGNTLVIAGEREPTFNNTIVLFVYQRDGQTGSWSLTQSIDVPQQRYRPFDLDIDGDRLVVLSESPIDGKVLSIFERAGGGDFTRSEQIMTSDFEISGFQQSFEVALDQNLIGVASQYPRARLDHVGAIFILEFDGDSWVEKPLLTDPDHEIRNALDIHDGTVFAASSQGVSRFDLPGTYNKKPRFTNRPAFQGVAGRLYSQLIEASDDSGIFEIVAEQLPGWLSLATNDGVTTLAGTPPSDASGEVIRLRVTDESGASSWQTFELELLAGDELPVIAETPPNQDLSDGRRLNLRPVISGTGPFTFQWLLEGSPLAGETNPTLSRDSLSPEDAGNYVLQVTNAVGTVETPPIAVAVRPADRNAGDWPTFGGDIRRLGHHPATLGSHRFLPAWSVQAHPSRALQRTVIAEGKVFVIPQIRFNGSQEVKAFDLESGQEVWSQSFPEANSMNPPTYHDGRIYFQRGNHSSDSQLWALNAEDGTTIWQSPFAAQWERYEAPAVSDDGIWVNGGSYGGLYGFNLDGSQKFFHRLPQEDGWAPALRDDLAFTWVYGTFTVHDPENGSVIWSMVPNSQDSRPRSSTGVPVVTAREALLRSSDLTLACIDLETRETRWQTSPYDFQSEEGHRFDFIPAVFDGSVYALADSKIVALDLETGEEQLVFAADQRLISGQPLILNDVIIAASENETYIFNLETGELVQTLPVGGLLSYSNGYLSLAGYDGQLHAYFANDIPDLAFTNLPPIIEDQPYQFQLEVAHLDQAEAVTVEVLDLPSLLNIDDQNLITANLTTDATSDAVQIQVRLSDGVNEPNVQTVTIPLISINDDPVFTLQDLSLPEDSPTLVIPIADIVSDEETAPADLALNVDLLDPQSQDPLIDSPVTATIGPNGLSLTPLPDRFGSLTLALTVRDSGGTIVSHQVNLEVTDVPDRPEIAAIIPAQTTSDDGADLVVDLAPFFSDRDPYDANLTYTLTQNSNPVILAGAPIDGSVLSLQFAEYREGSTDLTITATDLTGLSVTQTFTVTLPELPHPTVGVSSEVTLNRRTGLYEQTVTVTNNGARPVGGFTLNVGGLDKGYALFNGHEDAISHSRPLGVGESVTLTLEFHSSLSRETPSATFATEPILPEEPQVVVAAPNDPDRIHPMADGSILLEFASVPGKTYRIQYSTDMTTWHESPIPIAAAANRTQWLDQGLPKTNCHPSECPMRLYRVVEVDEEN